MYVHTHTYICTYIRMFVHTYIYTYMYPTYYVCDCCMYVHTYVHASSIRTYVHIMYVRITLLSQIEICTCVGNAYVKWNRTSSFLIRTVHRGCHRFYSRILPRYIVFQGGSQVNQFTANMHLSRPTSKCTFKPKTSVKASFQDNKTKHGASEVIHSQKTGLEKIFIDVILLSLKSLSWFAMNFAGWTEPPPTSVGHTLYTLPRIVCMYVRIRTYIRTTIHTCVPTYNTVLSEVYAGLYFHEFRKWVRICEILFANFGLAS